jgi:hypothetical protein
MLRPSRRQINRWRRQQRTRKVIVGAFVALLAVIVGILGFGYWRENIARAGESAAVVFGEQITLTQLLERVRPRARALDAQARIYEVQGMSQGAAQLNFQRGRLPDQALDALIEEEIVERELGLRGIELSAEEVDERIRKEVAEQEALNQPRPTPTPSPVPGAEPTATPAGPPTPTPVPTLAGDQFQTAYAALLSRAEITDAYYRDSIRAELAKEKLRESMKAVLPRTEEQVHVRHILLKDPESVAQAQEMLAAGTPFDQVASELSTDPGTKEKGGDLGWFGRGVMNPPFEAAAFGQPIGEIGPPVESPNGTHVIQVLERDEQRALTEQQLDQRAAQAYQGWYAGLKGSSDVRNELTPERRAWVLRQITPRRTG